jgi:hypothetical protein
MDGKGQPVKKYLEIVLDHGVKVVYKACGVCGPLQGEADVYEWRLGESDGEDLEVMLEAVQVSTCGVCNPLQGEAAVDQ